MTMIFNEKPDDVTSPRLVAEQELDKIYHAIPEWVHWDFPNLSLHEKVQKGFQQREKIMKNSNSHFNCPQCGVRLVISLKKATAKDGHYEGSNPPQKQWHASCDICGDDNCDGNCLERITNKEQPTVPINPPKETVREQLKIGFCPVCGETGCMGNCLDGVPLPGNPTWQLLTRICIEQFGITEQDIAFNKTFKDFVTDELDSIDFSMAIEDAFDIELPDEIFGDYIENASFLKLCKYIDTFLAKEQANGDAPYNAGRRDGVRDLKNNSKSPLYLNGDEDGDYSNTHRRYIEGYLDGFRFGT